MCRLLPYFSVSHSFPFTSLTVWEQSLFSLLTLSNCLGQIIISPQGSCALVILSYLFFSRLAMDPDAFVLLSPISSFYLPPLLSLSVNSFVRRSHDWLHQGNLALLSLKSYSTLYMFTICQSHYYCTEHAYSYIRVCLPRIRKLFERWDFALLSVYL